MRWAIRRAYRGSTSSGTLTSSSKLVSYLAQGLLVAGAFLGAAWLVRVYGHGLRDPRYLDGWLLAGIMSGQLIFHILRKTSTLSPKSAMRWRKFHILSGYLLCGVFVLHCDVSLPDTVFEWALWAGFVLVTVSGAFGTYLAWSLRISGRVDQGVGASGLSLRHTELAQQVRAVVAESRPAAATIDLPDLPHSAWIFHLYTDQLRNFFERERSVARHVIGSRRELKHLTDEIENLSRYVDPESQQRLAAIKDLVMEKDRLESARVHLRLTKAWLLVHVPLTYSLVVLTVVHILVVYSFSSGAW